MLVEVLVSSQRSSVCICVACTFLKVQGWRWDSKSLFMHVRIYIFIELVQQKHLCGKASLVGN